LTTVWGGEMLENNYFKNPILSSSPHNIFGALSSFLHPTCYFLNQDIYPFVKVEEYE